MQSLFRIRLTAASLALALAVGCARGGEPTGHALFASPLVSPIALSADGLLYVAHTTSDTVQVVDTATRKIVAEIPVGLEPVSVALRPDGKQLFVSNHVSDSVAVIDADPQSPTRHDVVQIIQDLDSRGATLFDEPVGIAFASDEKAYVALSSRNEIAVLLREGLRWRVRPERIQITAQDPRAIAVRDGRLYVLAFESTNQTELSNCARGDDPPQCTFGPLDTNKHEIPAGNILRDPDAPDRDLFVFDTSDDSPLDVVSHVGTLLYGLAVGPQGRVFVAHTEARNDVNGMQGGVLADLDDRMYLNRIARLDCGSGKCAFDTKTDYLPLEPAPPAQPAQGRQLATPYAIAASGDGKTLFATAAASDRIFSVDAASGAVQDVLDVGAVPKGIALHTGPGGAPDTAYVWNSLDSTLSVVDVSQPGQLALKATFPVGHDPTPEPIRRGRIAFESARASSTGTFACASCHPDAHMDQLIWRIGGECSKDLSPLCGKPIPRTTRPIRGLRNTLPLHWDGALGDPYGGPNGAVGLKGDGGKDCALGDADGDHDCFLDLVRTSISAVMCDHHPCSADDGRLTAAEQGDMATFLASVSYPPARSRAVDDRVSAQAIDGFEDFYVDQGGIDRGTCADTAQGCHVLPLGASTNGTAPVTGAFDAPSVLGLTDRFVQQSLGGNSSEEMLLFMNKPYGLQGAFAGTPPSPFPFDPAKGPDERSTFAVGFLYFRVDMGPVNAVDLFQMIEEMSTGTSGATGRQVVLDDATLRGEAVSATQTLLSELEAADARGVVQLSGKARNLLPAPDGSEPVAYLAERSAYRVGGHEMTRSALLDAARSGALRVTLTAHLPPHFGDFEQRQPLLATEKVGPGPTGDPAMPVLAGSRRFQLRGIDVADGAHIHVDGARAGGHVNCVKGKYEPRFCSSESVEIYLDEPPKAPGLHLVQLQNPDGPLSNEMPVCVPPIEECR